MHDKTLCEVISEAADRNAAQAFELAKWLRVSEERRQELERDVKRLVEQWYVRVGPAIT